MSLSIIIPVKNEEKIIEETLKHFANSWIKEIESEIIIIDDFSDDATLEKIKKFHDQNLNLKIIQNKKPGLGSAISMGIENSAKQFVAIFMADLSDNVIDLREYYNLIIKHNSDAILGSRFIKGSVVNNYPFSKYILNRIANNIIGLIFFVRYNDFTNAFKIYKKSTLLKLFPLVSDNYNIFLELPLKIISRKYNYKTIPISWNGRKKGVTKFNFKELRSKYIFTMLYCLLEKILLKK
jgi:dolichol-phosphate mannosyltransferase|tara:strand:- start:275 stop:988 length:714 start_codon:yes stop_codon:yes gene_type:complete